MTHTKGKWIYQEESKEFYDSLRKHQGRGRIKICVESTDKLSVLGYMELHEDILYEEAQSIARLIASAPERKEQNAELLKALKELVNFCKKEGYHGSGKREPVISRAQKLINNVS